ncbi:unnamed protein product [Mytilus coruscus]|uniref:F-box domain-containing protein n=1 Tax=Mytilus coruscus TaxID=42192 RepID=A0A6J8CCW0_MYTCO|nr:unnamed protein product [Mytilus coruscus]
MYTDLEHVCEEQIEMSKPNEVSDFDLLADSGYTEDMSQLSPVKNVDKSDSHLCCPSLNFSDDEMYQNCIEKRNTIEDSDVEPQHIRNSIIKTDIEFIEKEITPARIQVEEILTSDDDMFCTCPIFCLPREITMKIFTYFTQPELCCKLSRVCKSWYDYAFDPSLWKLLTFTTTSNIPSVNLCSLIAKSYKLKVTFIAWKKIFQKVRPVIYLLQQHNKYLTKLVIDGAEITDDCYKSIAICSYLTSFEASFCELLTDKNSNISRKGTEFTAVGLMNFFSSPGIKHLTSLDMSECTGCDDSCVSQLAQSCGKTLKQLSLCWCWHITDRGATSVVDHCRDLELLNLQGIKSMTGESFARIPTDMPFFNHVMFISL